MARTTSPESQPIGRRLPRLLDVRYRGGVGSAIGHGPLKYAPWLGGEFRWRLGVRPLDLDDWVQIGDDYAEQMATKAAARARCPETVLVALPEADAVCHEVLDMLTAHLVRLWPDDFARTAGEIVNHRTGEFLPLDGSMHPLDIAGRLVQEDLIVLVPRGDQLVCGAGSVCLPNRWNLRSKLGLSLAEVHGPVSRLNDQIGDPIDKFFARLSPEKSFWRLGWGVIDTPELFQPLDDSMPASPVPTADDLFVRVERETMRRLPATQGVLFTIRTYITKASEFAADPDHGDRLAEAVNAVPDDVREYKQLDVFAPALEKLFADARSSRTGVVLGL